MIRESADAAVAAAEHERRHRDRPRRDGRRGREVGRPDADACCAILREAGVVDSGGQGLYRLFQGALLHLVGQAPAARRAAGRAPAPRPSTLVAHADEGFGYETMFLLQPNGSRRASTSTRSATTSSRSASRSSSRATRRALKVHVHNERPDLVVGYGLALGHAQPDQRREPRQPGARRPRDAGRGVHRPSRPAPTAGDRAGSARRRDRDRPPAPRRSRVVAVVAGDGLAAIFRDFGVAAVVQGGQTANPSTGELLEAIEARRRPRDHRSCPTTRTWSSPRARSRRWPTGRSSSSRPATPPRASRRCSPLDPSLDAAANAGPMTEAGRADPDARRDRGRPRRDDRRPQGQARPDDRARPGRRARRRRTATATKAVLAAVAALRPGFELLTLFYGDGADLAEAEAMAAPDRGHAPGVEVEVRHGGQPFYRYLIAAE